MFKILWYTANCLDERPLFKLPGWPCCNCSSLNNLAWALHNNIYRTGISNDPWLKNTELRSGNVSLTWRFNGTAFGALTENCISFSITFPVELDITCSVIVFAEFLPLPNLSAMPARIV